MRVARAVPGCAAAARRHGCRARIDSVPVSALLERGQPVALSKRRRRLQPGEEKQKFSMHAFGAQFAEVRVDPDLGTIRVSRFVGAFDAGQC